VTFVWIAIGMPSMILLGSFLCCHQTNGNATIFTILEMQPAQLKKVVVKMTPARSIAPQSVMALWTVT
jgi:hypothetical protein